MTVKKNNEWGIFAFSLFIWSVALSLWSFMFIYGRSLNRGYTSNWQSILITEIFLVLYIGMVYYWIDRIVNNIEFFKRATYIIAVIVRTVFFILFCLCTILVLAAISALQNKSHYINELILLARGNPEVLRTIVFMVVISLLYNIILQFIRVFGVKMGTMISLGYYRKPKTHEMLFMGIDLNDFTSHTERLGNTRMSLFMKECFSIFEESIIKYNGEIYSYLGDAALAYWKNKKGVKNNNFLFGALDFFTRIEEKSEHFMNSYGFIPNFKVGNSMGEVIGCEIGLDKREIMFIGDAINTVLELFTIQKTNKLNPATDKIFISDALYKIMPPMPKEFGIRFFGALALGNKKKNTGVYVVKLNETDNTETQKTNTTTT